MDDATACEDLLDDVMWSRDLREYVTAHEDLVFHVPGRTFHICRAHPAARAVVEAGVIPAGFACPLGRATCPLVEAGSTRLGAAMHLVPVRIGPPRHPASPPFAAPAARVRSVPDGLSERGATGEVRVRGCVHHRS